MSIEYQGKTIAFYGGGCTVRGFMNLGHETLERAKVAGTVELAAPELAALKSLTEMSIGMCISGSAPKSGECVWQLDGFNRSYCTNCGRLKDPRNGV